MNNLHIISGVGHDSSEPYGHASCFLIETPAARVLMDIGKGVRRDALLEQAAKGRIDALVLSHAHGDHMGGLDQLPDIGNPPVYCTEPVLRRLPEGLNKHPLSLEKTNDIAGLALTIGRSGHTEGSIWMHFDVGDGLLYMSDTMYESPIYPFDEPPQARVAIVDASYDVYDSTLDAQIDELEKSIDGGPVLFPVTIDGRGPEIALHMDRYSDSSPQLCDDLRAECGRLSEPWIYPEARPALRRLAQPADQRSEKEVKIFIASGAGATDGNSKEVLSRIEGRPGLFVVFTGYKAGGPAAERLIKAGCAKGIRWNSHATISKNVALVRRVEAEIVIPAYASSRHRAGWEKAFAPAQVFLDKTLAI